MQALQSSQQNNAMYIRLITKSQDKDLKDKCPVFLSSKKLPDGKYEITGEYNTIVWYITSIKIRESEIVIENKITKKSFVQIGIYNDADNINLIIESWFNSVIKGTLSRLVSVDLEKTKVSIIVWKNKEGYPAGTVKNYDTNENIPFTEKYHPKAILDEIKKNPKAKAIEDDKETYNKFISVQSDKFYEGLVKELSELPKYQKPSHPTPTPTADLVATTESDDISFLDNPTTDDDELPF